MFKMEGTQNGLVVFVNHVFKIKARIVLVINFLLNTFVKAIYSINNKIPYPSLI